jgi:hypothetical protein
LIAKLPTASGIVADKGYDSEALREQIGQQGAKAVIPTTRTSVKGNADLDQRALAKSSLDGKRCCLPGSGIRFRQAQTQGSHGLLVSMAANEKRLRTPGTQLD